MMVSTYFVDYILEQWFASTPPVPLPPLPSKIYAALCTTFQQESVQPCLGEVSGGVSGYARQPVSWYNAGVNTKQNNTAITWATPTTNWAPATSPVICIALCDQLTGGHWLVAMEICPYIILANATAPQIAVSGLVVGMRSTFPV